MKRREGSERRRALEYRVLVGAMRHRERFISRLQRQVEGAGQCVLFKGSKRSNGYGRMSFRFNRQHLNIDVHRLFLILMMGRPIRIGFDAGHESGCPFRHCVRHIFEQDLYENAVTARGRG